MSEKMREDFESWINAAYGHDCSRRDDDGNYADIATCGQWEVWKFALTHENGGQESEDQAVARVEGDEAQRRLAWFDSLQDENAELFVAPPSVNAIETAALRKAAKLVRKRIGHRLADEILALIPQDGITALEEYCKQARKEALLDAVQVVIRNAVPYRNTAEEYADELRRMAEGEK